MVTLPLNNVLCISFGYFGQVVVAELVDNFAVAACMHRDGIDYFDCWIGVVGSFFVQNLLKDT